MQFSDERITNNGETDMVAQFGGMKDIFQLIKDKEFAQKLKSKDGEEGAYEQNMSINYWMNELQENVRKISKGRLDFQHYSHYMETFQSFRSVIY